MHKTIFITGSTDGIGRESARAFLAQGHRVLLHGRNADKLARLRHRLAHEFGSESLDTELADLSNLGQVRQLAERILDKGLQLDVLINNAGLFKVSPAVADNGLDLRFVVNTIAPWMLTRALLPALATDARVINLSSAAQAPVSVSALRGQQRIQDDFSAYAQSKLALTMWSMEPALIGLRDEHAMVAVNPGSLLASKMVREGFGTEGKDLGIGVRILERMALEPGAVRSGHYFDNDAGRYADPHPSAMQAENRIAVCEAIAGLVAGAQ